MLSAGLVSVTFRSLEPERIIDLVAQAGLSAVEWGGDIHVRPGDCARARQVGERTREAGLRVAAYGSYYRLTPEERASGQDEAVLDAAEALGAPLVRVWAGNQPSAQADEGVWEAVAGAARELGDKAAGRGLSVAFEYHGSTLTDTQASAVRLLRRVGTASVGTLWQPPVGMERGECLAGLRAVAPWLRNAHVFSWRECERLPLSEGAEKWRAYLRALREVPGDRYALLEFVKGDRPEQLLEDAGALLGWLKEIQ